MQPTPLLMIPGPTPLPEPVREALARPAMGHRSPEFKAILKRVFPRLQWAFQTVSDTFLYTASGTGAMEAALVNTLNPGDRVLALTCGVFSERWAEIAKSLGLAVDTVSVPHGQTNTVEQLKDVLGKANYQAVMLTHSETSTGVLNPVKALAQAIRQIQPDALCIVDAVTSLGAAEFDFDGWGIDLAVSGSQKGFMLPPGLSFLAVSERAWASHRACKNPGYYFNFTKNKKAQDEFTTAYTPATPLIAALDTALAMMEAETLPGICSRHAKLQTMTRAGVSALGLSLFVPQIEFASTAVTAVLPPDGVSVDAIRQGLKQDFAITVADGQKALKGQIFRVGHLGYVSEREVYLVLAALEKTLRKLGYSPRASAVEAAQQIDLNWLNREKQAVSS